MTDSEHYTGIAMSVLARLLRAHGPVDGDDLLAFYDVAITERWNAHEIQTQLSDGEFTPAALGERIRQARQDRDEPALAPPSQPVTTETFMRLFAEAAEKSRVDSARRRELVLKHPDLRDQLVGYLIGYSKPENWNGWIPPATDAKGARNNSPRRAALIALVAEAERREAA